MSADVSDQVGTGSADGSRPRRRAPRSRKLSEVVARMILQDILDDGLIEGAKLLSEAEMMEQYDIGRATLREALRLLEVQGLIVVRSGPSGGPVVRLLTPGDFGRMARLHLQLTGATYEHLVEARLILEPIMAGLAAAHRDLAGLERLEEAVSHGPEGVADDQRWVEVTRDFHYAVAGMSGNPVLDLIVRALKEIFEDKSRQALAPQDRRVDVHEAHDQVAKAIAAGDRDAAEQAMRVHMQDYAELVRSTRPGMLDELIEWD
jgi:GntR family transcriptional regulator, transcriptional repressor for pyruvate dehydrogenase complex